MCRSRTFLKLSSARPPSTSNSTINYSIGTDVLSLSLEILHQSRNENNEVNFSVDRGRDQRPSLIEFLVHLNQGYSSLLFT